MKKKACEISITQAKPLLGRLINRTAEERVILTRFGHPVAALVSMDDLDALQRLKRLEPFASMLVGPFFDGLEDARVNSVDDRAGRQLESEGDDAIR